MLFRLKREPIRREGKWWAWPTVAAVLAGFAVAIACARVVDFGPPFEVRVERAPDAASPDAWRATSERAAEVRSLAPAADRVEVVFQVLAPSGADVFVAFAGGPARASLNGVESKPEGERRSLPGDALREGENVLAVEPASAVRAIELTTAARRSERPRIVVARGGAVVPAGAAHPRNAMLAAILSIVVIFAAITVAPGHALAAVGLLYLVAAIGLAAANAARPERIFFSPGAALALALVPLAVVSLGTLLAERPAVRVFAEVFAIYLLGVPFHVAAPASGPTAAPAPHIIAETFAIARDLGAPGGALTILATLLAAAIAAGGALAVHRASLKLFKPEAADLALVLFAFGTTMLSFGTTDLGGEALAASAIAVALYGFSRAGEASGLRFDALAGAALGLAAASRLPAAIALGLAVAGLLLVSRPGRLLVVLASAAPFVGLIAWHDARTFGSPATTAYGPLASLATGALGAPSPEAAAGLLLSPSRGLFVYSPALLLALAGVVRFARRADSASIGVALFPVALVLLVAARGAGWSGGPASYGPRILTEALAPLALLAAAGVDHVLPTPGLRRPAWALVALSVAIHFLHFVFPGGAWNERYRDRLDAAAWRAPEVQIQSDALEAARDMGLR